MILSLLGMPPRSTLITFCSFLRFPMVAAQIWGGVAGWEPEEVDVLAEGPIGLTRKVSKT